MKLCVDVEINSPKDKVWSVVSDIENCSSVISAIVDLEILEKPELGLLGLKWKETRKMFGKESSETMWITDCVEEEYYCTRAENCGAIYITKISLEENAGKTLLSMSFSGETDTFWVKIVSALMGVFIKKSMIDALQNDLNDIKTHVERL